MTRKEFLDSFWRYYLILEERFEKSTRYIELNPDNYLCYSIDFVGQLESICSEIDVLMKVMCGFEAESRRSITDYAKKIMEQYEFIKNYEVVVGDIRIKPFDGWDVKNASVSLVWWSAYNSVKHGRNINFKMANLKNTLMSLMGLFLLEMLYFKRLSDKEGLPDVMSKGSKLFFITDWKTRFLCSNSLVLEVDSE